ncbi:MAG: hypothetical protein QM608_16750 [Caulobacter sp.]
MKRIHFDLRHLEHADNLELRIHGKRYPLRGHDDDTRLHAAQSNLALAALPPAAHAGFTHFGDIDVAHLAADTAIQLQVVEPEPEGVHLPKLVAMTLLIPENALRAYWESQFELYKQPLSRVRALHRAGVRRRPTVFCGKLASLGLTALHDDPATAIEQLVASQLLAEKFETAVALVAHHPNLSNIQPSTAARIKHSHILPDPRIDPDQYNAIQLLSEQIAKEGRGWSERIPCTDQHGEPLKAGYDLDPKEGGFTEGQQLYTWTITDSVGDLLGPACAGANRSASGDLSLANKTWAPNSGVASLAQEAGDTPAPPAAEAAAPEFKWVVNEQTNHHGVSVDQKSIKIDAKNLFSIDTSNSYLRTLVTAYQLRDDKGGPIGKKTKLGSISATNTILGIPAPTDPTRLEFDMGGASSVELYFGSLGASNWDDDVSTDGALLTCLWQYGVPTVFLVAGKAITSTSTFNKIVNDKDLRAAALAIAFAVVGGAVPTAAAVGNCKKVLTSFADVVLSIVLQKGMQTLGEWLAKEVAAGAISSAFGPVGLVLRAAATLMDFEMMAITTVEVLSSPACVNATVSRALDVSLTLLPDPKHGEVGDKTTAVWPALAQEYVVTLEYKGGTTRQLLGVFPDTTSGAPLPLRFVDVPAGGQFRILAGVYSRSGWLAGSWQSDWLKAEPNKGTTLELGEKAITENLVPLAPDTQYVFKEKIDTSGGDFAWKAGAPPVTTLSGLNCAAPSSLCDLVSITINNSAYQIGYAWRASGQNLPPDNPAAPPSDEQLFVLQNLSVLAEPGSRLKRSDIGLSNRPGIAYAPSYDAREEIDQTNFILDPRQSVMNLRKVTLDGKVGSFDLGEVGLESWGRFPLANLDALAVHPSKLVLAASFKESKLMILPIPEKGAEDTEAPLALTVSGEGIRQGLVRGPKAMTVAPDGRILVLESENLRVQAFDIKGNPVQCFTPAPAFFEVPLADVAGDLDAQKVPDALARAAVEIGSGALFFLSDAFVAQLDAHRFAPKDDPLIAALSDRGVILAYEPDAMDDPKLSAQIRVATPGEAWIITDPRGFAWMIRREDGELLVSTWLAKADIQVQSRGSRWLVVDQVSFTAWKVEQSTADPKVALVKPALSHFPLKTPRVGHATFLDMAVESQGYIYVLSHWGDGAAPTDYVLDIYGPDGVFCSRSPDPSVTREPQNVVAGKIAVDVWRNLYGLTYETLISPWGAPQPGVAHWVPTPPLFTLPLTLQRDFNDRNIGAIDVAFAEHKIKLTKEAFITVKDPNGAWEVKDGATLYHVYRSGDGLQVYAIPG